MQTIDWVSDTRQIRQSSALLGLIVLVALLSCCGMARAAELPDGRVLERVTPLDKNQGDASTGSVLDRDHVYFNAFASFFASDPWVTAGAHYFGTRTANGWTLAAGFLGPNTGVSDFSADYSKQVVTGRSPLLPADTDLASDIYVRSNGVLSLVSTGSLGGGSGDDVYYAGQSADSTHIAFETAEHLEPADPSADPGARVAGMQLYESVNGQARVVGILPDSVCASRALSAGCVDPSGAVLGDGTQQVGNASGSSNAITADGSRIFFESPDPAQGPSELYVRQDGNSTTQVSASRCDRVAPDPPCSGPSKVTFQGASANGNKVFFTTAAQLVNDDLDGNMDLYRYDLTSGDLARLSTIEGAIPCGNSSLGVCGVVAVSDDGKRVYFLATGRAAPGGATGAANLYLYDANENATTFIATVGTDEGIFEQGLYAANNLATATPDGRVLVFQSRARVTSFDNGGLAEIYRYEIGEDGVSCVSCNAAGIPPLPGPGGRSADIRDSFATNPYSIPPGPGGGSKSGTVLSDDGETVVFKSTDALVPADTNKRFDIYEWHSGVLSLLTSGVGAFDAALSGISPDGHDIFFTTYDQLLPQDTDFHADVYDARIGGNSRIPPTVPPECSGDDCQPAATVRAGSPTPGSAVLVGDGDLRPSRALSFSVRALSRQQRRALAHGKRSSLHVKVDRATRVTVVARGVVGGSRQVLFKAAKRARGGGIISLSMRLSKVARRRLASGHLLRVDLVVTASGTARQATQRFTLGL